MTRKRFCKLLMSMGCDRNDDQLMAKCREPGQSYKNLFEELQSDFNEAVDLIDSLASLMGSFGMSSTDITEALTESLGGIGYGYC